MTEKLKPCPFCGKDSIEIESNERFAYSTVCTCNACGTDGPRGNNEKDAILAWNTREHEK